MCSCLRIYSTRASKKLRAWRFEYSPLSSLSFVRLNYLIYNLFLAFYFPEGSSLTYLTPLVAISFPSSSDLYFRIAHLTFSMAFPFVLWQRSKDLKHDSNHIYYCKQDTSYSLIQRKLRASNKFSPQHNRIYPLVHWVTALMATIP